MRDALLIFGAISATTKATLATSANIVKLGASKPGNVENCKVCFRLEDNITSGDSVQPELLECATENGTYSVCAVGPVITDGKAGDIIEVNMPVNCKEFLKAGLMPASSGTFTQVDATAWVEHR